MNRRSFLLAAARSLVAAGAITSLATVAPAPAEASPAKPGGKRRRRRRRKGKKGGKKPKT